MILIPVDNIARRFNPFKSPVWTETPLSEDDVCACLERGHWKYGSKPEHCGIYSYHVARVAYLVRHPAHDPIQIDVGVPVLNYVPRWPIIDGNHRLAAAIYREAPSIAASIAGQLDYAEHLFGVDCQEPEFAGKPLVSAQKPCYNRIAGGFAAKSGPFHLV